MVNKIRLGKSDLQISPLVFGGNVFGWTADEKQSFELLDAFINAGFNSIDTANSYSRWVPGNTGGDSEKIIGNWLKRSGKRSAVNIFTKVGSQMPDGGKGLSKREIIKQADISLQRLQTDHIDLYFSHHDDPSVPQEETLAAYDELIQQGKVRYIGASNFTKERIASALKIAAENSLPEYVAIQPEYNLYEREFENTLAQFVKENDLGVVSYYGLASGFLSGKYKSSDDLAKSAREKTVSKYMNDKGIALIKKLESLSASSGFPMAAIALAWVLKNEAVTAPIASATDLHQLNELMKVGDPRIMNIDLDSLDDVK